MKRLFALFLAITLCTSLSLTSCKKKSDAVDAGAPITLEEVKADPTGAVERSAAEASQVGIFKTFENIGKLENVHVSLDIPNVADVEMWASVAENLKGFAMDLNDKQSDQIISANINQKHAAIGYDGKTYGIPVENTISVGDCYNDLPLLSAAGRGIAVKNADEELKKVFGAFAYSNDENAIGKIIEEYGFYREEE